MICRTEFSFRVAIGRVEQCFDRLPAGGIICDSTAYGHVPWAKEAKKRGVPRGLGARLRVGNADNWAELILVPTTNVGLRDLYSLVGKAARGPIAPTELGAGDWAAFRGPDARGKAPSLPPWVEIPFVPGAGLRGSAAAFSDNRYPAIADQRAWSFSLGAKAWRTAGAAHIQDDWELEAEGASPAALASNKALLERANEVVLPTAQNIKFPVADPQQTLAELTRAELARRGLGSEYVARLERELGLVADKKFADYFLVIADTIAWAKRKMLVGPGRGSSAGSIICWLLRITEIDPLQHKLLFERFIDINRFDLPDIDIDFPDEGRGSVLDYLAEKYGQANVAHIGTVMRYKPKSALTDVAKELKIPPWECAGKRLPARFNPAVRGRAKADREISGHPRRLRPRRRCATIRKACRGDDRL
jgi:DNA polymerase III alpha subunit